MAAFHHAPISRHEALAPFSRDHYAGLVQARHLVKAAGHDQVARRKAIAEFVDAFARDIAVHFEDEERLLAGVLRADDHDRLVGEHRRLTRLAEEARMLRREVDPDPAKLREIGDALEQHIRWEERELFNRLQRSLTDQQLEDIALETRRIEAARPRNINRGAQP